MMLSKKIAVGLVKLVALLLLSVVVVKALPGLTAASSGEVTANGNTAVSAPLGTPFTYQGELMENGEPVSGSYDFQFILYDAAVGGAQVGEILTMADLAVADGLFTAELDFGNVFTGSALWLEIGVRAGNSTGTYSILQPRQPLTAAPYALGLRPGAIITGTLAEPALTLSNGGGDGVTVYDAGGAANHSTSTGVAGLRVAGSAGSGLHIGYTAQDGIHIVESGLEGVDVVNSARDGFEVDNAAQDGLHVGTVGSDGVHVEAATSAGLRVNNAGTFGIRINSAAGHGLHIDNAGQRGLSVSNAAESGLYINHSDADGIFICATGSETFCVPTESDHGIHIGSAADHGIFMDKTGSNGVNVGQAGNIGLYVGSAGFVGVSVRGDALAGYFNGDIQVTGSCTGCVIATFGLNSSNETVEPGDVVTIQGVRPSGVDSLPILMEVAKASTGQAIVGVVQGWAQLHEEAEPRPSEIGLQLIPRDGAAEPGQYVTIIIYGPVQVRAGELAEGILPGAKLALNADGQARTLQTVVINGVQLAESAPVIGTALSEPDEDGMVWVLLNPQ